MESTTATVLLTPVLILLAALTTLMAHNLLTQTTVAFSRAIGFPLRRLFGIHGKGTALGTLCVFGFAFCMFSVAFFIFAGMLWTRYGGQASFFLWGLAVVIPAWILLRVIFVAFTGEPKAHQTQPGQKQRQTVLARRWHTIPTPEGAEPEKGNVFIKVEFLKWNHRRGVHIVSHIEQVPWEEISP